MHARMTLIGNWCIMEAALEDLARSYTFHGPHVVLQVGKGHAINLRRSAAASGWQCIHENMHILPFLASHSAYLYSNPRIRPCLRAHADASFAAHAAALQVAGCITEQHRTWPAAVAALHPRRHLAQERQQRASTLTGASSHTASKYARMRMGVTGSWAKAALAPSTRLSWMAARLLPSSS